MNSGAIFFGIIPLLVFVIVDSFAGLKTALITTVLFGLGEAIFSYYHFKEIDIVSISSLFLVFLLAGTSYYFKNSLYLKFQPVILSLGIGLWLIVSYFLGKPLLLIMMIKYQSFLTADVQQKMSDPLMQEILKYSTLYCGYGLLGHAATTAYAAYRLSNWWWIAIRGIGFYAFCTIGFIMATFAAYKSQ